jgi:nitrogen regulatory protein PII
MALSCRLHCVSGSLQSLPTIEQIRFFLSILSGPGLGELRLRGTKVASLLSIHLRTLNERKLVPMKLLIAFIRPELVVAVQAAVKGLELRTMTASEVLDYQEQGPTEIYRGLQFRRPVSKVQLEIVAEDELLAAAVEAIERAGDARVFVIALDEHADPFVHIKRHPGFRSLSPIPQ